ncbi:MAG TPA: phosphopantetheine-binding protein, partial [Longimicrobiaceae bacterium]
VRLVDTYGPTETTVVATLTELGGGAVSIGRPVPNGRAHVLDADLRPLPVGVRGELYVGGAGVARGYLGRPELTAERFLPDPFSAEPGARVYRTGDVARWRRDGELEYAGRADDQVKVRGFRVEPGEVEGVLLRHPGVRETAVVAREDEPGRTRLVAYVVPAGGTDTAELRAHLRAELPEHMVPTAWVALDALPRLPNGKVDRRALPAPETRAEAGYVAPRDPNEERLAEIWASVLGAARVGVHDGFFELGGHSLLATRVVSRIREQWGVEVPLRAVFEGPTVAELARLLPETVEAAPTEAIHAAAASVEEELLGRLDELSDAEMERLLAELSPE